jgi:hypothetical protein
MDFKQTISFSAGTREIFSSSVSCYFPRIQRSGQVRPRKKLKVPKSFWFGTGNKKPRSKEE